MTPWTDVVFHAATVLCLIAAVATIRAMNRAIVHLTAVVLNLTEAYAALLEQMKHLALVRVEFQGPEDTKGKPN